MSNQEQPVELPPINLLADGPSPEIREANQEAILPSPGYPDTCFLLVEAIIKRVDICLLDYTKDQVAIRFQIDGVWHEMPPRDRTSGDYLLATIKKLANLNYQERRARQEGEFGAEYRMKTYRFEFTSQGVRTGERVVIRVDRKKKPLKTLEDLGMRPRMREALHEHFHAQDGLVLMSTLPGDGKSTLWSCTLGNIDRFMRDFYSIENQNAAENEIINIAQITYDADLGETPKDKLPQLLLRQPDAICFPDLVNGEVVDEITALANEQHKLVVGFSPARSAVETLLRVLVHKPDVQAFADSIKAVVHQRIVRKLCDNCKQAYQPAPQLLAKLGLPANRVPQLFDEWRPPPPEQQVDEKGNPIEIPICPKCNGIGYYGRTGIFELLIINDDIRKVLVSNPSLEALSEAAQKSGHISLKDEAVVLVAKGVTSVQEIQRVLKR